MRLQAGLPAERRRGWQSKSGNRLYRLKGLREELESAVEVGQVCRAWRRLVAPHNVARMS